jgi:hypothetical protein
MIGFAHDYYGYVLANSLAGSNGHIRENDMRRGICSMAIDWKE